MTRATFRGFLLFVVLAALLIAPAAASAINPVSFSQVGNLTTKRDAPGAALLPDGRVLVVGGWDGASYLNSAEIFNPSTNTFAGLGATMTDMRWGPGVAPLPDGRVLIAGGLDGSDDIATAEVFNPGTGSFSPVGSMAEGRETPAVALLPDGRVLIGGGYSNGSSLASSEIFDPNTNAFTPGPALPGPRYGAASAMISGGRTLIAGGYDGSDYLSSALVFNPTSAIFGPVGELPNHVYGAAGASLPQGRALVAGGYDGSESDEIPLAVIFDPSTNSFSSAGIGNLIRQRQEAAAAELADGRVLIAGGYDGVALDTAEVLSVPSNAFTAKLKGRKVTFTVTNEGTAMVSDTSVKVATTAKKKKPKLAKTKTRHGGPGKIIVKVKLTKVGAARLAEKGKIRIRVAYTPDQGIAATKKLKLRAGK